MAEAPAIQLDLAREQTPLRVRLRWAFHRARAAILPRRWVIPWEMRANSRFFAKAIADARARDAVSDEIFALESEEAHYYFALHEELEMLESSRLLKKAAKYMLPTPPRVPRALVDPDADPNWQQGTVFAPTWYLRCEAMQELRAQIRAERKARLEPIGEWVKIIGAIIGGAGGAVYLVSTLIGLLHR